MSQGRHPILADSSALIAIGTSDLWKLARDSLAVTSTNVCLTELRRHERESHEYAPDGSREHRLHHGSKRAVDAFDSDDAAFSAVTVVGVPSGTDAGERSIEKELSVNPAAYRYVVLNDAGARDRLRRKKERDDLSYSVVPPTFLLYVLFDNDVVTRAQFCSGCAELMKAEGWTNAGAVHAMWEGIPVDCSGYVEDRLLPD